MRVCARVEACPRVSEMKEGRKKGFSNLLLINFTTSEAQSQGGVNERVREEGKNGRRWKGWVEGGEMKGWGGLRIKEEGEEGEQNKLREVKSYRRKSGRVKMKPHCTWIISTGHLFADHTTLFIPLHWTLRSLPQQACGLID